jgi:membrane peptidoglycan carboxypeptidase
VYVAPQMITRIEDRDGKVLATFGSAPPERALPVAAAQTLIDVMRGVVDYGTGADIRARYGIRIDVAGKTGTTQDNTDGWFILMHPQLVAGAWVGFDDGSVTLRSDYWAQARTARCRSSARSSMRRCVRARSTRACSSRRISGRAARRRRSGVRRIRACSTG